MTTMADLVRRGIFGLPVLIGAGVAVQREAFGPSTA
jgi:hypothetical protein